jgi:hypothetical protein
MFVPLHWYNSVMPPDATASRVLTFPVSDGLQAKHVKATTIQVPVVLATGEIPLLLIDVMPVPPAFAILINEQKKPALGVSASLSKN